MKNKRIPINAKVAVIDDIIKGIVVSIHGKEVTIKDENDFLYIYQASELVVLQEESLLQNIAVPNKVKSKEKQKQKKIIKKNNEIILEVDLHIHQITKSNKGMDNYAILTKQLSVAKQQLELAIHTNIKSIVFIHGVGKGVLKENLYQLLKKYPVKINDASYQKYGQGATEVIIYKSKI